MVLIAVGANLPAPDGTSALATCMAAAHQLRALHGLSFVAESGWYETAPMPPSGQPAFVNGALRLEGEPDPAALLATLHAIEASFGRRRGLPNAARTLDLDLLAIGALVRRAPDPVLPHPRLHERAFVLRPLLDIAPEWGHPLIGLTVRDLWEDLPAQVIRPLTPPLQADSAATN
jgi:2-amino-4-hydroxy-6-hydroxymethyldihydropteridine diphosphokinase